MDRTKITLLLLTSLIFLFFPLVVLAKEKKVEPPKGLLPEKDTYVNSAYPQVNFGTEEKISTGFTASSKIIFIEFNLDNLTEIKDDEEVVLNIWLEQTYGPLQPIEMELLLPHSDWEEKELNWNNKPSLYQSGLSVVLEATPGAQTIDLTPLVKQWLDKTIKNQGVAFYHNLESFSRTFFSKENEKYPPSLVVQKKKKPVRLAENLFQTSIKENIVNLPLLLQQKSRVKGTQTKRTLNDYLGQQSIIPIVGLWIASVFGLLIKMIKV